MNFIELSSVSFGFDWTQVHCWIVKGFARFLLGFTGFLSIFVKFDIDSLRFYLVLLGFTEFCCFFTDFRQVLHCFIKVLLGFAGFH